MVEIQLPLVTRLSDYLQRELEGAISRGTFTDVNVSVHILSFMFHKDIPDGDVSRIYRLTVKTNQDENLSIGEYHINVAPNALTRSYLGFFPKIGDSYQQLPSGLLVPQTNEPHVFTTGDVREEFKQQVLELYHREFSKLASEQFPYLPTESLEYFWQMDFVDKNIFREYFEREREWWEENIGPFELVKNTDYHAYWTQYLEKPPEELPHVQYLLPSGHEEVQNNPSYQQFLATCFEDLLKGVKINRTVLITRRMDISFP